METTDDMIQDKLKALDGLFRRGSKSHAAAAEVLMADKELSKAERQLICAKIGISPKTLGYVLTRLRKAGLYGPNVIAEVLSKDKVEPEESKEVEVESKVEKDIEKETREEQTSSTPPKQVNDFVTRQEFEQLVSEIRALSAVLMGQNPDTAPNIPYEASLHEDPPQLAASWNPVEPIEPGIEEAELSDVSMKQMGTWVKAKNLLFFDLAKEGAFGGALAGFNGNWSDFVNLVIEDYFKRMGVGVGLLSRRFV